jgi:hypothetical protein
MLQHLRHKDMYLSIHEIIKKYILENNSVSKNSGI